MKRPNQGFTLLELMITLVVLAVLLSLAAPLLDVFDKRRVTAATEAMFSDMRFAKSEAIKQSRDISVVVQNDGGSWCMGVTDKDDCDCSETTPTASEACTISEDGSDNNRVLRVVRSADFEGATMTSGDFSLAFDSVRGNLIGVNNNSITMASDKGAQLRVVVSRMGRVRICSPDGSIGGYPSC